MQNEAAASAAAPRIANCDQEAWVQDRILAAMQMALAMKREVHVRADGMAFDFGLRGIAEGAAIEVIHTLGMLPAGVNLRVPKPTGNISNLGKL